MWLQGHCAKSNRCGMTGSSYKAVTRATEGTDFVCTGCIVTCSTGYIGTTQTSMNTFCVPGCFYTSLNRYTDPSVRLSREQPNYTIELVTLGKVKKYIKSQIYGQLEHF